LIPQSDALATPAPKVFPDDALLPLHLPAEQIRDRVRGFNPSPGAWLWLDGKKLRVHDSAIIRESEYNRDHRLEFKTPAGVIRFTVVQLEGKSKQSAEDFIRGYAGSWVFEGKKQYI
jgi:methionyl-tRNA formyltransferase